VLALLGLPAMRVMIVLWVGAFLNAAVFYGSARFRAPLEPTLAIMTGLGLQLLLQSRSWKAS
jgi:hypothetical protein